MAKVCPCLTAPLILLPQLGLLPGSTRMPDEHLTIGECDELEEALRQQASSLSDGPKKENLLKLAESYRALAEMKRIVLRLTN